MFNELPGDLRELTKCGVDKFRAKLDEFLQMIPDQPKCSGLTPVAQKPDAPHSNSLFYQVAWPRQRTLLPFVSAPQLAR